MQSVKLKVDMNLNFILNLHAIPKSCLKLDNICISENCREPAYHKGKWD